MDAFRHGPNIVFRQLITASVHVATVDRVRVGVQLSE